MKIQSFSKCWNGRFLEFWFLKNWEVEKMQNFYNVPITVWKNEKFTLTQKISRQINYLVNSLGNALLSRNIFQVRVNFSFFHTVSYIVEIEVLLCRIYQNWFHVKSKWQTNPESFTLCVIFVCQSQCSKHEIYSTWQKFRESNAFPKEFTK